MIDRKKLDQMEDCGAVAAMKYRDKLGMEIQNAVNDTVTALNNYFDDVRAKRNAISERVDALRAEHADLEVEISSFGPKLAQATISGDGAALESIQLNGRLQTWRPTKRLFPHRLTCCQRCRSQGMRIFTVKPTSWRTSWRP